MMYCRDGNYIRKDRWMIHCDDHSNAPDYVLFVRTEEEEGCNSGIEVSYNEIENHVHNTGWSDVVEFTGNNTEDTILLDLDDMFEVLRDRDLNMVQELDGDREQYAEDLGIVNRYWNWRRDIVER